MPIDVNLLREPIVVYGLILIGLIIYRQPLIEWLQRRSRVEELAGRQVDQLAENLKEWRTTNAELRGIKAETSHVHEELEAARKGIEALLPLANDAIQTLHRVSETLARIEGRSAK